MMAGTNWRHWNGHYRRFLTSGPQTRSVRNGVPAPSRGNPITKRNDETRTWIVVSDGTDNTARKQAGEALLKAGALQSAIFNSANFSSIATDAKGLIQIFNVGAERMLGYTAAEVMNKITSAA